MKHSLARVLLTNAQTTTSRNEEQTVFASTRITGTAEATSSLLIHVCILRAVYSFCCSVPTLRIRYIDCY